MEYKLALGKAIHTARRSKGLTQEAVDNSRTYLSDVERGIKEVSSLKLHSYSNSIGVHPLTLITMSYLNANPEINLKQLHELVSREISELSKPKRKKEPVFKKV